MLTKWYHGGFEDIADSKEYYMGAGGFEQVFSQIMSALEFIKPMCSHIRLILFPVTKEGRLDTETPREVTELYDRLIREFDIAVNAVPSH